MIDDKIMRWCVRILGMLTVLAVICAFAAVILGFGRITGLF